MDNDQKDDSSPEDDMAGLLRQEWRVIKGGLAKPAQKDNLEWSVRIDLRRRAVLKPL